MTREHTKHSRQPGGFHFPAQFFLGVLFTFVGGLILANKLGLVDLMGFPESILLYVSALGSFLGGIYLIIHKIWRPRIYL